MMNMILTYLHENRERLNLERYGVQGQLSSIVLTPRFRASSHVVFLIFDDNHQAPVLVVKVPRLANASDKLEREATNLQMFQTLREEGFTSIPSLVAFEEVGGYSILVETALVGRPMEPIVVRRERNRCCLAIVDWLSEIQWPASTKRPAESELFEQLVETPYRYFTERFPLSVEEGKLLEQTWAIIAGLRELALPTVFEHGDLSHPNLFLLQSSELGVVDWETAEPYGLPACDLFFFLNYAAVSMHNTRNTSEYLSAFRSAFFGEQAWGRYYVGMYARRLQLSDLALTPLFVLCWLRYMVSLLTRLEHGGEETAQIRPDTADWLRNNRFYALWKQSVVHVDELGWWGSNQYA
jgi:aminoglycoside phosphotransferase (APT) family kinase protein